MKKGWIIAIAIVAVLVIWFATGYNSLVKQEEGREILKAIKPGTYVMN